MASTTLTRTPASAGNQQIGTFSLWFKRSGLSGTYIYFISDGTNQFSIFINGSQQIGLFHYNGSTNDFKLESNAVLRDVNSWYHLTVEINTTEATSSNRVKMYLNGEQITSLLTSDYPSLNFNGIMFKNSSTIIGNDTGSSHFDGSMAHFHGIDGTAYDASAFGQTDATSGIWVPKPFPSVTYGTNGFFLKFGNAGSLGTDSSGNANNFTVNGTGTQTLDTPSNVFATLNPLTNDGGGAKTYSFGNTKVAETANSWTSAHTGLAVSTGKYYFEAKVTYTSNNEAYIGAASQKAILDKVTSTHYLGQTADSVGFYTGNGSYYKGAGAVSYGSSVSSGDIVGCALDLDNNYIYFSINGTWQNSGDPESGATGTGGISLPSGMTTGDYISLSVSPNESYLECNFGNGYFGTTAVSTPESDSAGLGKFEYSVPTGYYALCTKNIADYG